MSERVHTASTLAFVGGILSLAIGVIYLLVGIGVIVAFGVSVFGIVYLILGILEVTCGVLTWMMARPKLVQGDLKNGAIMCFVFGSLSIPAIGGILTLVAGILAMMESGEQKQPPPPPPP